MELIPTKEDILVSEYVFQGHIELIKRNYKNATAQFNRAIEVFPDSLPALLGRALTSTRQLDENPLDGDESKAMLQRIISDLEHLSEKIQ